MDKQFKSRIHAILRSWHQDDNGSESLSDLRLHQRKAVAVNAPPHKITEYVIVDALEKMEEKYAADADLLRQRFMDKELAFRVANERHESDATFYRKQSKAIERLATTIEALELEAQDEYRDALLQRLEPPSYTELFGVEEHIVELSARLLLPSAPWIVAIGGVGGIGKTSLANAVARNQLESGYWEEFGWVKARQITLSLGGEINEKRESQLDAEGLIEELVDQLLPELAHSPIPQAEKLTTLRQKLSERPHLIIIDNLETVIDLGNLLPHLSPLCGPTKFLLTSRNSIFGEAGVSYFQVPELSLTNALSLVRLEGKIRSLPHVTQASDDELRPIYDVVGGNPLALRLVTGQLHIHPLNDILEDLHDAGGAKSRNLYTYIYRKIWDSLDESARQALLVMPLASSQGASLELLCQISQMDRSDLYQALDRLVSFNLVDSHGGLNERSYSIHNLTRTFLHEQVAQW